MIIGSRCRRNPPIGRAVINSSDADPYTTCSEDATTLIQKGGFALIELLHETGDAADHVDVPVIGPPIGVVVEIPSAEMLSPADAGNIEVTSLIIPLEAEPS